jgi:hypothetical protein
MLDLVDSTYVLFICRQYVGAGVAPARRIANAFIADPVIPLNSDLLPFPLQAFIFSIVCLI